MRGPEAPVAGAEDGVTRRIHALLDPARTPGFDWRAELREGGHRKKVQAYGLSFAEKCLQAERFADARLLLEAYAQARRAAGLSEDPRALELHARGRKFRRIGRSSDALTAYAPRVRSKVRAFFSLRPSLVSSRAASVRRRVDDGRETRARAHQRERARERARPRATHASQ